MNTKKRFYAKLIDICVVVFFFFIFTTLTFNNSMFYYMFTYPLVSVLFLYLYFGLLGNYVDGSLGKKIVGLEIVDERDGFEPSMFNLFIREPISQIVLLLLSIAFVFMIIYNILYIFFNTSLSTIGLNFTIFGILFVLISVIYIAAFAIKHDWWNKKYRIETKDNIDIVDI